MGESHPIVDHHGSQSTQVALNPRARWGFADFLSLGVLLLFAAWLRWHFASSGLSFDELWHLSLSAGKAAPNGWFAGDILYPAPGHVTLDDGTKSFAQVWSGMNGVLHPPLYIVTLRFWRALFGQSDAAAQWLSITWSLAAVAGVFGAARTALGRGLAILCALAFILSPTQGYFAQEVRGYQMLIGLAALTLWLMTRIEVTGVTRRRAILLGLAPLPLLLTHYFAAGAALAIVIHGFTRLRGQRAAFSIALLSGALIYTVAWLPFAIRQVAFIGTGDAFMKVPEISLVHESLELASAPFRLLVDRTYDAQPSWLVGGLLLLLPWFLTRRAPWLWPWALWLVLSLLLLVTLDVTRTTLHITMVRYLAVASPAVLLVAAGCARAVDKRAAYVLAGGLVFMCGVYGYSGIEIASDCQSFDSTIRALEPRIAPGEAILVYHGNAPLYYGDMLLLTCSHSETLFPRPAMNITRPIGPETVDRLPRRAWLIAAGIDMPISKLVPGARELGNFTADVGVTMFHIEIDPSPATVPTTSP